MAGQSVADITDSTDWLETEVREFAQVEASLRCEICKDFYTTPMTTECDHTFCSLCIRRILTDSGKCPLCLANSQISRLRKSVALEQTIQAFTTARSALLSFCQKRPPQPTVVPVPVSPTSKRSHDEIAPPSPAASNNVESSRRSKRLRSSNKVPSYAEPNLPEDSDAQTPHKSSTADPDYHTEPEQPPDDGLVACPICSKRMKEALVFPHIDNGCNSVGSSQPSPRNPAPSILVSRSNPFQRSAPANWTPERLPTTNYSLLKDNALRKKMTEQGLSTTGTRAILIRRHQEWTTLWNANCDAAQPRRKQDVLRDLDVWERTVLNPKPTFASRNATPDIKDKNFDGDAWQTKHEDSFKSLIEEARRTRLAAQKRAQDAAAEDAAAAATAATAAAVAVAVKPIEHLTSATEIIDLDNDYADCEVIDDCQVIPETPPPEFDEPLPDTPAQVFP